jgi:hypothetical protein
MHSQWVDLRRFPKPPRRLTDKIRFALDWFPCDLLCVHRDAETVGLQKRRLEIEQAVSAVSVDRGLVPPAVCVVPVRMMEAWFVFDESALREAAGNPNGRQPLALPAMKRVEDIADPKECLHDLLTVASGLQGRRRRSFNVEASVHRLAEIIDDFSPLRPLPAFQSLEDDVRNLILQNNWNQMP